MDATARRPRAKFVQIPLDWAVAMTKATRTPKALIAIELAYAAWQADGAAFTLPAGRLERAGISRHMRRRVLRELEAAKLIELERRLGKPSLIRMVGL